MWAERLPEIEPCPVRSAARSDVLQTRGSPQIRKLVRPRSVAHYYAALRAVQQPGHKGSDIAAFDFFLQRLYQIGNALHTRIERECAAIDFQRLLVVTKILQDQAKAG